MKSILIPKVDAAKRITVKVYRGKTIDMIHARLFILKRQLIAGIEVPKDSRIKAPLSAFTQNYMQDEISIEGAYVNKLLKYLFLESLRNGYFPIDSK